jgi:hypothetical protein
MSDELIPFHVPAPVALGGGLNGNIHRLPDSVQNAGEVELQVAGGGPVFLVFGRRNAGDIAQSIHSTNPDDVDFDLAASVQGGTAKLRTEDVTGFTVYSDVESWGYVRVSV